MVNKIFKNLVIGYIVSFTLLIVFALIMYYCDVSDKVVGVFVLVTYFISTLFAGFGMGTNVDSRKFLWGLLVGVLYFVIIFLFSLIGGIGSREISTSVLIGFCFCGFGGMIGGMIS